MHGTIDYKHEQEATFITAIVRERTCTVIPVWVYGCYDRRWNGCHPNDRKPVSP